MPKHSDRSFYYFLWSRGGSSMLIPKIGLPKAQESQQVLCDSLKDLNVFSRA